MQDTVLPAHIRDAVNEIAELHARHEREATPAHRLFDRAVQSVGRPAFVGILTAIIAGWLAANLMLSAAGFAFDPPPFPILQNFGALAALYITVLILITTSREKKLGEYREHLTLQLAILNDQKSAKIIELLEELRRDDPALRDRIDGVAEALSVPAKPQAVLDAINNTNEVVRGSVAAGKSSLDGGPSPPKT
ncbi:MAG: hypothetical protein JWM91_2550 [Rhodospirillales bacterium]|nr:hypothetical protein [Rhodospirillales bacterium]